MSESSKNRKFRIGRKQFIIAIVSVCLVAVIAEAVLLVHTFSKKKDKEKVPPLKEGAVWRVTEVTMREAGDTTLYQLQYDEKARAIRMDRTLHYGDGDFKMSPLQAEYYPGGCCIYWDGYDREGVEYFDPMDLDWSQSLYVVDYEVDDSGRLTVMKTTEDGEKTWRFDAEGRPVRIEYDNGQITEFQYDDMGRLSSIYADEWKWTTVTTYENETRTIAYRDETGRDVAVWEYKGPFPLSKTMFDERESITQRERYYMPKGNYDFTGSEGHRFLSMIEDSIYDWLSCQAGEDIYSMSKTLVETDSSGQPLRMLDEEGDVRTEYRYDKAGRVSERIDRDSNGKVQWEFCTEYDAYGNLTRIYEKEGQMDYRFKWSQIEVTQ